MANLPTGTVTFLLADVQGCTKLVELGVHEDVLHASVRRHASMIHAGIEQNLGRVFQEAADEVFAGFSSAPAALEAALAAQRSLRSMPPEAIAPAAALSLKVRMALHTGTVELVEGEYT